MRESIIAVVVCLLILYVLTHSDTGTWLWTYSQLVKNNVTGNLSDWQQS